MTTQGESDDIKDNDQLSQWLIHFGLTKFESGLRDEGIDDFQIIKTIDDESIDEVAKAIDMKKLQKKALIKGVKAVRDGTYGSSPGASTTSTNPAILALRQQRADLQGDVKREVDEEVGVNDGKKTRTIIFIGESGTGKTTLINSMTNYLEAVSYDEPFRYKLIMESKDEGIDEKKSSSQTKEINTYHLRNLAAIDDALNVIDTPGFGDTNGPKQDREIQGKFRDFFQNVPAIDGIYFVLKSSDTRLSAVQKYIFNMVLNVFGADVKDNIFLLFTFADGAKPPVLEVVKEIEVFKDAMPRWFKINNSGFKLPDVEKDPSQEMFFDLGCKQFEIIFDALSKTESKSTVNTIQTLKERDNITTWLFNIGQHVKAVLDKKSAMDTNLEYLIANKHTADANKDFEYPDEETKIHKDPLPHDRYTTYCARCNSTCHQKCQIKNDEDKWKCWAMDASGFCTQCVGKCPWRDSKTEDQFHKNVPYIIRRETITVMKTKEEMAKKYKLAKNKELKHADFINGKRKEIAELRDHIIKSIENMRKAVNTLQKVALNKKVLTPDEYFDTLIASETKDKESGWMKRVELLEDMKKENKLLRNIVESDNIEVLQNIDSGMDKYNVASDYQSININLNVQIEQKVDEPPSGTFIGVKNKDKSYGFNIDGLNFSFLFGKNKEKKTKEIKGKGSKTKGKGTQL